MNSNLLNSAQNLLYPARAEVLVNMITSLKQHPTKQRLYCHIPPISQIIQVSRTRQERSCCRNKDGMIKRRFVMNSWTWMRKYLLSSKSYSCQLYADTGCCLENQSGKIYARDRWPERGNSVGLDNEEWNWNLISPVKKKRERDFKIQ